MEFENKIAVITGAAAGIGKAIAEMFALEGAHVVCGDVDEVELRRTVLALGAAGGRAEAVVCDVTSADDVETLLATAEKLGGPHAVVAQAGTGFAASVEDTTPEEWDRVMAVDAKGTFLTVRAAIPRMRKVGGGAIVAMSGTFAVYGEPNHSAHCAAKGAILSFTRAVALEYANQGIRCNAVLPGYVATPMVDRSFDRAGGDIVRQRVSKWHALGRLARPDEVATLVLFLCSNRSSFCTGQPFVIDGGLSAGIKAYQKRGERE